MRRREERSPLGADEGAAAAATTTTTTTKTKRPRLWMASACKAASSSCCCSCSNRRRAALAVLVALLVASLVLHPVALRGSAWLVAAATGRPLPWQHSVVMITCPTEAVARDMARSLVERRLAACVSIIPKITSFFHWEGHVEEQGEFLLVVKTRSSLVPSLEEHVRASHPYEVPEVIGLEIEQGSAAYLQWIDQSLAAP